MAYYMCVCILDLAMQHANQIFSAQHYVVLCGLSGFTIFFTLSDKWQNFNKKIINIKYKFSVTLVSHSETNSVRYHLCTEIFMWSAHYSCQILIKLEFSWDFQKILQYQISWKSIQCELVYTMWTESTKDRQADTTKQSVTVISCMCLKTSVLASLQLTSCMPFLVPQRHLSQYWHPPYASVNICRVPLMLLASIAQDVMLTQRSNYLAPILAMRQKRNTCMNTAAALLLLSYLLQQHIRNRTTDMTNP